LATSFNVELVYIILKGVTSFTKELKNIESGKSSNKKTKIKRRVDKSKLTLNAVKIKDPKIWDVMSTEDFVQKDHEQTSRMSKFFKRKSQLIDEGE